MTLVHPRKDLGVPGESWDGSGEDQRALGGPRRDFGVPGGSQEGFGGPKGGVWGSGVPLTSRRAVTLALLWGLCARQVKGPLSPGPTGPSRRVPLVKMNARSSCSAGSSAAVSLGGSPCQGGLRGPGEGPGEGVSLTTRQWARGPRRRGSAGTPSGSPPPRTGSRLASGSSPAALGGAWGSERGVWTPPQTS